MNINMLMEKKINIKELIFLTILSIFWLDSRGYGFYLPLILIPIVLIYLFSNHITSEKVFLFSFSTCYALFSYMYGFISIGVALFYIVYPISFYLLGSNIFKKKDINHKKLYRLLIVMTISNTLYGFGCVVKALSIYGMIGGESMSGMRYGINIWNNNLLSATLLNSHLSFALSIFFVLFLKKLHAGRALKTLILICFAISTYSILMLGNRTGFLIVFASLVGLYFHLGGSGKSKVRILIGLAFLFIVLLVFYSQNIFGIKDFIDSSTLFSRFSNINLQQDPRFVMWNLAFKALFEYPMGGKLAVMPLSHAHNFWLDVGNAAGIVPFSMLLMFSISSLRSVYRLTTNKLVPILLRGLFTGIYISFFITFFVEPIMEGFFAYFCTFCLLAGIVQRLNINYKLITQEIEKENMNGQVTNSII